MSPLLRIREVARSYPDGEGEHVVLGGVSFDIEHAVQMGIFGGPRSGKSTLLRIAAGVEQPDSGSVLFDGRDLSRARPSARARLLRRCIGFVAAGPSRPAAGEEVVDHVATVLGSDGYTPKDARRRARRALEQIAPELGREGLRMGLLCAAERARVALARALVREPRLLIVDEPAVMPNVSDRDRFCALLRNACRERGTALLSASAELAAVQGLDVLVYLSRGELIGAQQAREATVVQMPLRRGAQAR